MLRADFVIVGSGLTGASVARTLADAGREVVVLERRPQVGGNVRDAVHASGIRYGSWGPHYFRTNCERLWAWVQRFSPFFPWSAKVQTLIAGRFRRWPLRTGDEYLREMAVLGYSRKMWGGPPPEEALVRVERRQDDSDERLKTDRFQGLPVNGYSAWVEEMLAGVEVRTDFDYLMHRDKVEARRKLIFTGPVDEYYGFDLGRLAYRAQRRRLVYSDVPVQVQEVVQVNYPEPTTEILRSIEWNHAAERPDWRAGSLRTLETPYSPDDPDCFEYPVNDQMNAALRQQYAARAQAEDRVIFAGRLGRGVYLDMDAACAAGIKLAERFIAEGN